MPFKKGQSGNPKGKPKGTISKKHHPDVSFSMNLIEDLIGTFKSGKFYVYKHIYKGEVVYIGKGKNNRAWDIVDRKLEHASLMKLCAMKIRIIASDLSEDEALAVEAALIKVNCPKFNIAHCPIIDENQTELTFKEELTSI